MFAILDNKSGLILGKYMFRENIEQEINQDIIDLLGGALTSIIRILEEVYQSAGFLREIEKDMFKVLFEPREYITRIFFTDAKS